MFAEQGPGRVYELGSDELPEVGRSAGAIRAMVAARPERTFTRVAAGALLMPTVKLSIQGGNRVPPSNAAGH